MFELATLLLAVWCFLTVQTLVNVSVFRPLAKATNPSSSRVSIVIPARNEERYVGRTLDAALAQEYPDFQVIVVDDGSTDETPNEIASRSTDARLLPVEARPLERGWLGKPNALATGAARATGRWILFMDADVELHPRALADAVSACEKNGWDHLALVPRFLTVGFWEALLMPLVPIAAFVYLPSYLSFIARTRVAVGGGAFGLFRREAYEAIGGHALIKSSVVDDVRLAMELKSAGYESTPRLGLHRLRLRMYHGLDEIVEGFTKNAHAGFGRSTVLPVVVTVFSLWVGLTPFAWPVWALLAPASAWDGTARAVGLSLLLLVSCRVLVSLRVGLPIWPVVFSPVSTAVSVHIMLRSLWMARRDGVVRWRGREYPHESTEF